MSPARKGVIASALVVLAIGSVITLAAWRYQNYRIQKIDFIVWDRAHDNTASLSESGFVVYVQACGAEAVRADNHLRISYRGIFSSKQWTVPLNGK